jgi:hypothetical protein
LKRLIIFALLGIHLFTIGGYMPVLEYLIHQSDVQIVKEIYDNKINTKKLIELKIPVHLPDVQSWSDFEHVEGQVVLKDTFYNYVRMKITRDTLDLLCIPNTAKTRLQKANVILAKEFSDVPLGKKGHDGSTKRSIDLQYHFISTSYVYDREPIPLTQKYSDVVAKLLNPCLKTRGQPPEHCC